MSTSLDLETSRAAPKATIGDSRAGFAGLDRPEASLAERVRRLRNVHPMRIRRFHAVLTGVRILGDLAATWASFGLGWFLHESLASTSGEVPLGGLLFQVSACALVVLTFAYVGLYSRKRSIMNIREYQQLLQGWGLSCAAVFGLVFLARLPLRPSALLAMWAVLLPLVTVWRDLFRTFNRALHRRGLGETAALVYGAGETGRRLVRKLRQSPQLGIHVLGYLDDDTSLHGQEFEDVPVLGRFEELRALVRLTQVDRVYIALPQVPRRTVLDILQVCRERGIDFQIVPTLHDMILQRMQIQEIDGIPLLGLSSPRLRRWNALKKRAFDLVVASALVVVLSPLLALLAWGVHRSGPGGVIFRQKRVGQDGKLFEIWKFRSMHVDAPKYALTPKDGSDPRITPVGRFLRKTSLDELPQLWNVLRGEMSLVGPRPEMPFLVAGYDALQRERLNVPPGMTGLWQISPDRAGAIHENMDYDIHYIRHQSLLMDVAILLQTAKVVLLPRHAC